MKAFDKFCGILDKVATAITAVMVVFLTLLIGVNIISRYVLNNPIAWQYEATLVCMSWIIFIGMSITFRIDEHMRLTFVSNALPENVRNIWLVIMDLIVLAFLAYGGFLSISVVANGMNTTYQTIPITRAWFYMPFPIGCVFSICHIINTSYKRLNGIPIVDAPKAE